MNRLNLLNLLLALLVTSCASTTITAEPGRLTRTDIAAERGMVVIVTVDREIGSLGRVLRKRETRTIMTFYKPLPVQGYFDNPDQGIALRASK